MHITMKTWKISDLISIQSSYYSGVQLTISEFIFAGRQANPFKPEAIKIDR